MTRAWSEIPAECAIGWIRVAAHLSDAARERIVEVMDRCRNEDGSPRPEMRAEFEAAVRAELAAAPHGTIAALRWDALCAGVPTAEVFELDEDGLRARLAPRRDERAPPAPAPVDPFAGVVIPDSVTREDGRAAFCELVDRFGVDARELFDRSDHYLVSRVHFARAVHLPKGT